MTVLVPTWLTAYRLGLLAAASLALQSAFAQPANDNFADATPIAGIWGALTNDTGGATSEALEPSHAGLPPMETVWYKWVAPQAGEVTLDTFGSDFNTVLAVYTGSNLVNLAQVAANDGMNFGGNSAQDAYFSQFGLPHRGDTPL